MEFEWVRIFVKADVFHIHWPETYLSSKSIFKYTFGSIAVISLLVYFRFRGIPIVWSVHNIRPHSNKYFFLNSLFYTCLHRLVNHYIVMNEFQMIGFPKNKVSLLRHGMTFKQNLSKDICEKSGKYFLMFGSISKYKNHIEVIKYWEEYFHEYVLKICGWCSDKSYLDELNQAVIGLNIEIHSEFIEEDKLNDLIDDSVAVILNYGQNNSGVMYKTLERGTPILAVNTEFSSEIAGQFPGLIHTYDSIINVNVQKVINCTKEVVYNENYDWTNVSRKCEKILSDVVSTGRLPI